MKFDAIWVVGGEVGGVDSFDALRMSLPAEQIRSAEKNGYMSQLAKTKLINESNTIAYIPNLAIYPLNKKTPLIVNSVGISRTSNPADLKRYIKKATVLSVRDQASFDWCKKEKLEACLNPDVVGCISRLYKPAKVEESIIFQANKKYITARGVATVVDRLQQIHQQLSIKAPVNIALVAAGTASNHDDTRQLEAIANKLNQLQVPAYVVQNRNPLRIVDLVANARVVIATSLHMRIVAASYGVPRVSLENDKVTGYVKKWDANQPYDVKLREVVESVNIALEQDHKWPGKYKKMSFDSIKLAQKKCRRGSRVSNTVKDNNYWFIDIMSKEYEDMYLAADKEIVNLSKTNTSLQFELDSKKAQIEHLEGVMVDIKSSKAWKFVETYRRLRNNLGKLKSS